MSITLDCQGCGKRIRTKDEHAGKKVKCPACAAVCLVPTAPAGPAAEEVAVRPAPAEGGTYGLADDPAAEAPRPAKASGARRRPPVPQPAPPPKKGAAPAAEGDCPKCGSALAEDAVICIECGFNRKTGKQLKTVSKRLERHWDTGGMPYLVRLVIYLVLLPLTLLPGFLWEDWDVSLVLFVVGSILGAGLLGSLTRLTVTRDPQGRPILVRTYYVFFIRCGRYVIDLEDYATIRLGHSATGGGVSVFLVLLIIGMLLLTGPLGIIFLMRAILASSGDTQSGGGWFTLEIVGRSDFGGEPVIEPMKLYHGRSEGQMRALGDALEEIADLRYG
jgi:hypothetical protein